jgi:hypothetical protein
MPYEVVRFCYQWHSFMLHTETCLKSRRSTKIHVLLSVLCNGAFKEYLASVIYEWVWSTGGMIMMGENEVSRENPVTVPPCPSTNPIWTDLGPTSGFRVIYDFQSDIGMDSCAKCHSIEAPHSFIQPFICRPADGRQTHHRPVSKRLCSAKSRE